jgi:hypothetical protein
MKTKLLKIVRRKFWINYYPSLKIYELVTPKERYTDVYRERLIECYYEKIRDYLKTNHLSNAKINKIR